MLDFNPSASTTLNIKCEGLKALVKTHSSNGMYAGDRKRNRTQALLL